jgi:hypothetical protein
LARWVAGKARAVITEEVDAECAFLQVDLNFPSVGFLVVEHPPDAAALFTRVGSSRSPDSLTRMKGNRPEGWMSISFSRFNMAWLTQD